MWVGSSWRVAPVNRCDEPLKRKWRVRSSERDICRARATNCPLRVRWDILCSRDLR